MKDGQQIVKCFAGDDPAVEESDDVAGDTGGDERSFAYALDALAEEEGEDCGQGCLLYTSPCKRFMEAVFLLNGHFQMNGL